MLAAVAFGALIATQTRINGELGRRLDDGYLAAVLSFGIGLAILGTIAALSAPVRGGAMRIAVAVRRGEIPWWYTAGGVAGAFFVLSQGLTAAVLGVALFSVSIVSGQTLASLLIDGRGIGTMVPRPVTARRIAGLVLALIAVGVAVSPHVQGEILLWMIALPILAGIGTGWQQAVNGQARDVAGSALAAALVNFTVGTVVLAVAFAVRAVLVGLPSELPAEPWLYLGGPIAVVFIAGAAAVVRFTGVLVLGLGTIAGQLIASIMLDIVVPPEGHVLTATTVVGAALALVAVAIASLPARRGSGQASRNREGPPTAPK